MFKLGERVRRRLLVGEIPMEILRFYRSDLSCSIPRQGEIRSVAEAGIGTWRFSHGKWRIVGWVAPEQAVIVEAAAENI